MPTGLRSGIFNLPAEKNSALAGCGGLAPLSPRERIIRQNRNQWRVRIEDSSYRPRFRRLVVTYSLATVRNCSSLISFPFLPFHQFPFVWPHIFAIGMSPPLSISPPTLSCNPPSHICTYELVQLIRRLPAYNTSSWSTLPRCTRAVSDCQLKLTYMSTDE